jgi:hypothetical protein
MKKSKRQKISFNEINKGKIKKIPAKDIAESRARIAKEMKDFIANPKPIIKKQCKHYPDCIMLMEDKCCSSTCPFFKKKLKNV